MEVYLRLVETVDHFATIVTKWNYKNNKFDPSSLITFNEDEDYIQ